MISLRQWRHSSLIFLLCEGCNRGLVWGRLENKIIIRIDEYSSELAYPISPETGVMLFASRTIQAHSHSRKQSQLQNKSLSKSPRAPKAHLCAYNYVAPHVYRWRKFSDCSRCDNVSWTTSHRKTGMPYTNRNKYFLQTLEFVRLIRSRPFLNKDVELISKEIRKSERE